MPSHHLNQCWLIVNWSLRNTSQRNFIWNSNIFIQENAFENDVCKMAAILFRPQCNEQLPCTYLTSCDVHIQTHLGSFTALHCNVASHWPGAYTKWFLILLGQYANQSYQNPIITTEAILKKPYLSSNIHTDRQMDGWMDRRTDRHWFHSLSHLLLVCFLFYEGLAFLPQTTRPDLVAAEWLHRRRDRQYRHRRRRHHHRLRQFCLEYQNKALEQGAHLWNT